MIRIILLTSLFVFVTVGSALSESLSITIKPSSGLAGTISFNIHENNHTTLLKYIGPSQIQEDSVNVEPELTSKIKSLAHNAIADFMAARDYSQWPETKESISVIIAKDKVTKSISTRRLSADLLEIKKIIEEQIKH